MIWKKITINTTVEATDIVASVLFDNGIVGVEIEDKQNLNSDDLKKMYVDIPEILEDDGKSKVNFFVSIGEKINNKFSNVNTNLVDNSYMMSTDNIFTKDEFDSILKNIINDLKSYQDFINMGSLEIEENELDDNVFLNKWKENFKSLEIDNINILPEWEKPKDGMINIYIEPGNAFGTGNHPTTKLCVSAINKIFNEHNNISLLDIGTGSGILSIIAYTLGAKNVVAIDIDENCELNIKENLKLNNINEYGKINDLANDVLFNKRFIYGFGNILENNDLCEIIKTISYDVVVLNILAPVIISMIEKGNISAYLKTGGSLILSGIIEDKKDDVIDTLNKSKSFYDINCKSDGEWVMITCKKR